jgi:uncharacterized pyridoxal phosphate-containing UPF0001 family protein
VTKTFGADAVTAALGAGIVDIGENYAAELVAKAALVTGLTESGAPVPRWHFLGAIQRNKVGRLTPIVSCWQSISREAEAEAIALRAREAGVEMPSGFVEVNLTDDEGRGGCAPGRVGAVVDAARTAGIELRGLMAVAPQGGSEVASAAFARVARLASEHGLTELSIGMSGDLEEAVRAGSTMVRVGTALFGPRIPHTPSAGL